MNHEERLLIEFTTELSLLSILNSPLKEACFFGLYLS